MVASQSGRDAGPGRSARSRAELLVAAGLAAHGSLGVSLYLVAASFPMPV